MSRTADEIRDVDLRQSVRGYNIDQVDDLLDEIADDLERVTAERDALQRRLATVEEELAEARELEQTLKRTLVHAQRAAEQTVDDARTQADELLAAARRDAAEERDEARREADRLRVEATESARADVDELHRRKAALEDEIESLRRFEQDYRTHLGGSIRSLLARLEETGSSMAGVPLQVTEPDGTVGEPAAGIPAGPDGPAVGGGPAAEEGAPDAAAPAVEVAAAADDDVAVPAGRTRESDAPGAEDAPERGFAIDDHGDEDEAAFLATDEDELLTSVLFGDDASDTYLEGRVLDDEAAPDGDGRDGDPSPDADEEGGHGTRTGAGAGGDDAAASDDEAATTAADDGSPEDDEDAAAWWDRRDWPGG